MVVGKEVKRDRGYHGMREERDSSGKVNSSRKGEVLGKGE